MILRDFGLYIYAIESIYDTFTSIFEWAFIPLDFTGIAWIADALDKIGSLGPFGHFLTDIISRGWTPFELVFGAGLLGVVMYRIIKWILDIVL